MGGKERRTGGKRERGMLQVAVHYSQNLPGDVSEQTRAPQPLRLAAEVCC